MNYLHSTLLHLLGSISETRLGNSEVFDFSKIVRSFLSQDFALYITSFFLLYLLFVGTITTFAVVIFKVDYTSNVDSKQVKREIFLTLEGLTTYAFTFYALLRSNSWDTDTNIFGIAGSFFVIINLFNLWFYISHRLWHSNRMLYKYVHADHHKSVIVCPLTSFANGWIESVWLSFGFMVGPLLFGTNNVWGWFLAQGAIMLGSVIGHARIPYTLEHAAHHVLVTKNFGFFFALSVGFFNWDLCFGTWAFAANVPKIKKEYVKEIVTYTWNKDTRKINWEKFLYGQARKHLGTSNVGCSKGASSG